LTACIKERKPGQIIRIHNNINKLNLHEVVGMVELAAQCGVDEVEFNPTYHTPDICVDYHSAHAFAAAQQQIVEAAKRLGVKATFMRNLALDFEIREPELVQIGFSRLRETAEILAIPVERLVELADDSPHMEVVRDVLI
jgi:hypothetical protein